MSESRLGRQWSLAALTAILTWVITGHVRAADPADTAAPAPTGVLPVHEIRGGPVSRPSTDPHNLEGTWAQADGLSSGVFNAAAANLPYTPETLARVTRAKALSKQGFGQLATPQLTCRPTGVADITSLFFPAVIVQTPQELVVLIEENRNVYQIHLNRGHPAHLRPTYNGDSVGHWEGNTLVVDTIGYNGWGLIDPVGNPNSDQMHMVQRFTKSADGSLLEIDTTLDDPKDYTQPIHMHKQWTWDSGERQVENDCSEDPASDEAAHYKYENDEFRPVCRVVASDGNGLRKVNCKIPAAK